MRYVVGVLPYMLGQVGDIAVTKTILFGGLFHETHTFLAEKTGLEAFRRGGLAVGEDAIRYAVGNGSPSDGFLSFALERQWAILPTVHMSAMPGGMVEAEAFDFFRRTFFEAMDRHLGNVDGIFLVLHGAMVSENSDDVEGELLGAITERMHAAGHVVPVVAVLDLHANVSAAMVRFSTALRAYRLNPHSDAREAAVEAAKLLELALSGAPLRQAFLPTRYVFPPSGLGTSDEPMRSVLAAARALEASNPDLLCINVLAGYCYADIADCGFSLTAVTKGPEAEAKAALRELEEVLIQNAPAAYRLEYELPGALAEADKLPPGTGPVLLIEASDNIGGGSPGDATGVLEAILATGRDGIMAALADPEAVEACIRAGIGATVDLLIGGKSDAHHGRTLPFRGTVKSLSDGRFDLENRQSHLASMSGIHADMGPSAVVENAQASVLLSSRKLPPMDLGQFHSQGLYPEKARYVVVKAGVSHRDAYDPIARASYYIDSPGLCTSNLTRLPYRKLRGKIIGPADLPAPRSPTR